MRIPTNQPVKWNASQGVLNIAQFVNLIFMDTFRQTKIAMEHPPFFLVNTIKMVDFPASVWLVYRKSVPHNKVLVTGSSGPQTATESTESESYRQGQGLGGFTGWAKDKLRETHKPYHDIKTRTNMSSNNNNKEEEEKGEEEEEEGEEEGKNR